MSHCVMLQTSEIQAIVGDADRDGAGGRQYGGVWPLTSTPCVPDDDVLDDVQEDRSDLRSDRALGDKPDAKGGRACGTR